MPVYAADDFETFCRINPKPCPLLEVTEPGCYELQEFAQNTDLRTDLPKYRVFKNGVAVEEPQDILNWWRDDLVAFLLGCSFSFEQALLQAGFTLRHIEEQKNISMYRTSIPCKPAGNFHGETVVSMRPISSDRIQEAVEITSRYPFAHGAPLHTGDPSVIGIHDLQCPDFGDPVTIHPGEVPVFWACGVTPQAVIKESNIGFAITHSPGCMFVSDVRSDEFVWEQL
jgi:uncharacterized protein YcsI (UPF0317 family)